MRGLQSVGFCAEDWMPLVNPAHEAAHLWVVRTAGVLRGLTHRFGNGLHALSLIGGDGHDGLAAEDVGFVREELAQFETLTEQYRALVLALEEEPSAGRVEDALAIAVALWKAHVAVREPELTPIIDGDPPAVLAAPTALAQALTLLLLGDQPDATERPRVRVTGDAAQAIVELRAAHLQHDDRALDDSARWLLRATVPAVEIVRAVDADGPYLRLILPSLRTSRRAAVPTPG